MKTIKELVRNRVANQRFLAQLCKSNRTNWEAFKGYKNWEKKNVKPS